mmetsp:Transcript_25294/g.80174  ORF Transcript_25294/g.80174 Transcript_25294/m.80174 type:complete len:335 (-) Transcript_25294:820-1824(-)
MSEKMASRSPIVNRSPVDATCWLVGWLVVGAAVGSPVCVHGVRTQRGGDRNLGRSMAISGDLDAARGSSELVCVWCASCGRGRGCLAQAVWRRLARLLPRDDHLQHRLADHEEHELGVPRDAEVRVEGERDAVARKVRPREEPLARLAKHLAHVGPEAGEQEQSDEQSRGGCVIAVPLSGREAAWHSGSSPGDSSCSPTNHTTIPPHSSTRISAACKEGSETQGSEGARRDLPRLSARLPPRRLLRREESHLQPPADPQHLGEHDRAKACEELCVAHRSVAQPDLKRPDVRGGDEEQKVGGEVEEAVESTGRNQSAAVSHLGGPDAQHRDEDGG